MTIFDSGGFCVHLSLPSSTREGSDPILHVTYSFIDSVSAYNSNVDDLLLILVLAPIMIMILFLLQQVHVQSDLDDSPGDNNDSDTSIVMLL